LLHLRRTQTLADITPPVCTLTFATVVVYAQRQRQLPWQARKAYRGFTLIELPVLITAP